MKFFLQLILIALLSYLLSFYLAWYTPVIIAFIICFLIHSSSIMSFIAGFLGTGLVWLALSFKMDMDTHSIMTEKIVQLFPFSDATYLIIGAGLVGGIVGGMGALTGNSFRLMFIKKKTRSIYG